MADTCPPISPAVGDHRYYNDMRPATESTTTSPQQPEQTSHYPREPELFNDNDAPQKGNILSVISSEESVQQPPITETVGDSADGSDSDVVNGEDDENGEDADEDAEESDEGLNRVVAAEIEAVKEIERGPSEAALRRMKLIELYVVARAHTRL